MSESGYIAVIQRRGVSEEPLILEAADMAQLVDKIQRRSKLRGRGGAEPWPPSCDEFLRANYDRLSAEEIAVELTKMARPIAVRNRQRRKVFTRNAVIGRAHRLGLSKGSKA